MNDLQKLGKLLHHWKHHNEEHAEVYRQWAGKASSLEQKELATVLGRLHAETEALNQYFDSAIDLLSRTERP